MYCVIFIQTNRVEEQDSNIDIGPRDHETVFSKWNRKRKFVRSKNVIFRFNYLWGFMESIHNEHNMTSE